MIEIARFEPTIAANAVQAEQGRKVPNENIALLKSIGMYRVFQSKAFGAKEYCCPGLPIASRCSRVPVPVPPSQEHSLQKAEDLIVGRSADFGLYPDRKIFYSPYRPDFASDFSTVSLGIAERRLDVLCEKTKIRVRAYVGAAVSAATPALMRLV